MTAMAEEMTEIREFSAPDGRRLAYTDTGGTGAPVLCLAGLTRNHRDFDRLGAHLAPRYRVIRLDSRGRGMSGWAIEPLSEYIVPVETGDVIALLRHLTLGPVTVIGTSRGGILGMALASGLPGAVRALVLNDVGAVIDARGLLRIYATLGREPRAATFEEAGRALMAENARGFPDVPAARWVEHARALYREDETGRPRLSYDPRLRSAVGVALEGVDGEVSLWPMFDSLLELPVLVLRGENSDILSPKTVAQMAARHPGLVHVEIPGRGHAPFLDEPEALAAIDAFLAGLD